MYINIVTIDIIKFVVAKKVPTQIINYSSNEGFYFKEILIDTINSILTN